MPAAVPTAGVVWLSLAAFVWVVGFLKNINLLVLLGCALLAVFLLNVVAARRPLRGLAARRRVAGPVVAGASCAVEVRVEAARPGRRGFRLEDAGPAHHLSWFAARPDRDGPSFRGRVVLPQRGRYAWGPAWATSGYPFGLFRWRREAAPAEEVLVLPRAGRLHRGRFRRLLLGAAFEQDRARRAPLRRPDAQDQFHGLRPFRPGDSPRAIHWRTTARRGERMVREFEDVPGDNLLLVFDPAAPSLTPSPFPPGERGRGEGGRDPFEDAVSLAAAVAGEWRRDKGDRLMAVVAGPDPAVLDGPAGPAQTRRVLERLALVEPRPPDASDDAALLCRLATLPPAAVVLVSAAGSRLAGVLERALRRPVVCLTGADVGGLDFYKPPA